MKSRLNPFTERIILILFLALANLTFAMADSPRCSKFYTFKTTKKKLYSQIKDKNMLAYIEKENLSIVSRYKFNKAVKELEPFLYLDTNTFLGEYSKSWTHGTEIPLKAIKTLQVVVAVKSSKDQIHYYNLFLFHENAGDHRVLYELLSEAFIKDNLSNEEYNNFNIESNVHAVYFGQILLAKERGTKKFQYIDSDDLQYRRSYEDYRSNRGSLTKIPESISKLHPDDVHEFEIKNPHIP